jgi:DNA repair protein RadD
MLQMKHPGLRPAKIKMHPYQELLVRQLRQAYRDEAFPCLVLATGGGKTVISAGLARSSQDKARRVWFVCHKDFLVSQTSATFDLMGVEHGVLAAAFPFSGWAKTMVVSIDTLRSRMRKIPLDERPDVLVWDECHHSPSASWRAVWEWAGPDCFHMGLTATPIRLDGRGLAPVEEGGPGFTRMICGPTTADLMEMGFLSRYRAFAPSRIDLSKVGKQMGEFNKKQLTKAVISQVVVGDIIGHYKRLAENTRAIYFCVSVAYSQELAKAFSAAGYPARHLDARDNAETRSSAARAFARGELRVLTNVGLFTEGYDLAAQAGMPVTVETVGLVRPTMSESLAIQQMGRCLRAKDYPGIIIDHADVIEMHGLPDTDRDWSLQGRTKKPGSKTSVKMCPKCFAMVRASLRVCDCGYDFGAVSKVRELDFQEGELVEIDQKTFNERRRSWRQTIDACKTYGDFVKAGRYLGYKSGWAHHAWREFKEHGHVSRRSPL